MYCESDYLPQAEEDRLDREQYYALCEAEAEREEELERERLADPAFVDPDDRLPEPIQAALQGLVRRVA